VAACGADDENLLPILRRLSHPTFFTLDRDFYRADWSHADYCLAWLDVRRCDAGQFIRRFLRHGVFASQAQRMGVVARIHGEGITFWRTPQGRPGSVPWKTQ
jgi:hypothetical protein